MWVSVTRLRLHSLWHVLPFLTATRAIARQAQRSGGFVEGKLLIDRRLTFWTMTAWQNEACMRTFRASGAHGQAMPKLTRWCREAGFAGWEHSAPELPAWEESHRRIQMVGRKSRVERPAPAVDPAPRPRVLRVFEAALRKKPAPGTAAAARA